MAVVIVGLMRDPHQARGVVRALADGGFDREEIDTSGGLVSGLAQRGVPENEAHSFAEGARRGGTVVCVRTDDEMEAQRAALIMAEHGAMDIDACTAGWRSQGWKGRIAEPQSAVTIEHYSLIFGSYPTGAGKMYRDPRRRPGGSYRGPERRTRDQPYAGTNRRAV